MLQGCFRLLRGVLNDDKPALTADEFLKNYNILDLLKQHSKTKNLNIYAFTNMSVKQTLCWKNPRFVDNLIGSCQ